MKGFSGFPNGKLRLTQLPSLFFSDLLPIIDDVAELKVTLYAFWALAQQDGPVRYLRLADFLGDKTFIDGMGPTPTLAAAAAVDGIERAVARGTFLQVNVEGSDGRSDLYFINSPKGRASVDGITRGEWRPHPDMDEPVSLLVERPNIFVLYEQNIGQLTPMITEELREAEQTYPTQWVEEAIEVAVTNNARSWRYVRAILDRWRQEGKDRGTHQRDSGERPQNAIPDEYDDIVQR